MKPASTLLQTIALTACLAVQLVASGELAMPGMRRALQTINAIGEQVVQPGSPVLLLSGR